MRMYDIIAKKRDGGALTPEEIGFFIGGVTSGRIPDYQISALLMALFLRGMDRGETAELTRRMARSGDQMDLSAIPGVKVDKHSTGGVGDKTTLIVAPVVAACGVPVAKMSGRGLGHTGGTIDKLEAIPGFQTTLSKDAFYTAVKTTGLSIISSTGNLAPADKALYALRDVTATVESIPLIASSIMSKKLAAGADKILLDVKTGSGAFMKTPGQALELARTMVEIGTAVGRETAALVTEMDVPLGNAVGNALEIAEVCETLKGRGPADLEALCVELAAYMLRLAGKGGIEGCRAAARQALDSGAALARFGSMIENQRGDARVLEDYGRMGAAALQYEVRAKSGGYLGSMDTCRIGTAAMILGAGRENKESGIDYTAGIMLCKKAGDAVHSGETVAVLHTADEAKAKAAEELFLSGIGIVVEKPAQKPLVYAAVTKDGSELF